MSPAAAGELLVLVVTDSGEGSGPLTAADISDSATSTWSLESANNWGVTGQTQYVFTAIDSGSSSDTVSVTTVSTTASSATAVVFALANINAPAPIDSLGTFASGTSSTPSASVTTGVAGDLVLGILSTTTGTTVTHTSGYTEIASVDDSVSTVSYAEDAAVTTPATYSSSPTLSSSTNWGIEAIAIAEQLGAGPPSPSSPILDGGQSVTLTASPTGGTSSYTLQWYSGTGSGGCAGTALGTSLTQSTGALAPGSYYYCYVVTDGSSGTVLSFWDSVTVNTALVVGTPTPGSQTVDRGQTATTTGTTPTTGTSSYQYQWLEEPPSAGSYSDATNCAAPITLTCSFLTSGPTVTGAYSFELQVTDSATVASVVSSSPVTVTVNTALTAPAAPTITSNPLVDQGQTSTLTASIPSSGTSSYSWQWLFSTNGGSGYVNATAAQCATSGGSGALAGATETCSFVTTGSTPTGNYLFELEVTDSASTPQSVTSTASSTVTVESALATANAPTVSTADIDQGQTPTAATVTLPTALGGTGTVTYTWLVSFNGGAYAAATSSQCATPSGTASNGEVVNCVVGGSVPAGTYTFELKLTDSAATPTHTISGASGSVTVNSALSAPGAPTVTSNAVVDQGQVSTLTATIPSSGTGPYLWSWLYSTNGGTSYNAATSAECSTPSGSGALAGATETCSFATTGSTGTGSYLFELKVTDSATTTESATSGASSAVKVNAALTAPGAPAITSNPVVDLGQTSTLTGAIPSSGTSPYSWQWLYSTNAGSSYIAATSTQCATPSGSGALAGATETCSFATTGSTATGSYLFELRVTDAATTPVTVTSSASSTVSVNSALTAPAAPTPSAVSLDVNQALTVTAILPTTGTAPYAWSWFISMDGGSYAAATQCASNSGTGATAGSTETCAIAASSLTMGDTYAFELKVTDSATTQESATSPTSSTVTVSSTLTVPATPTPSATKLDLNQALTVTGAIPSTGTPTYSWQWLTSINSGAYAAATLFAVNSGTGAAGGATETCSIAASSLAPGSTYSFELKATDSATAPESAISLASTTVTVSSTLTAPAAPSVSATKLDANQALTVTATVPSTGTSSYAWAWLTSITGGSFTASTQCAVNSGSGAAGGATETCSIAANSLTAGDTYAFELQVTDSATAPESTTSTASSTVTVSSALAAPAAPTITGNPIVDLGQTSTLTANVPGSGTSTYSWQWLYSTNAGTSYSAATASQCATPSGSGALAGATETCSFVTTGSTATGSYLFELRVTDSATSAESATSVASSAVTVNAALTAPAAPTPSATKLDLNQALTVTATIPSTGTATYSWQWMISINGGGYAAATQCATNGGGGAAGGASESCAIAAGSLTAGTSYAFELKVTDSASTAEIATSSASATVTVSSTLVAPGTPTPSAAKLDVNQALSVTGTIPSTGTAPYSWQWMLSTNGGADAPATQCGSSGSGSGATAGTLETCTVPASTLTAGDSYTFEIQATDSASTAESAISAASSSVTVGTALTAPSAPSPSATKLDVNQALTVSGTVPSSGTAPYQYEWLVSTGSGYSKATICAIPSASGASAGPVTCSVAASVLAAGTTYSFELLSNDSATTPETQTSVPSTGVAVAPTLTAPVAPTLSGAKLDANQALTVSATIPSTGSALYQYEWLVSTGAGYTKATVCGTPSANGASAGSVTCAVAGGALTPGMSYSFELKVNDSATAPETQTSPASSAVAVSSALTAPLAPTASAGKLDVNQALTVSGSIPSTGTSPYEYEWLVSTGASYTKASVCTPSSATGASAGAVSCSITSGTLTAGTIYTFELLVNDSASTPESGTSVPSSSVTVAASLTPPGAPTITANPVVDQGQASTLTATIPSSGTAPYSYQWLFSTNGGGLYNPATAAECGTPSGSAATGGTVETCSFSTTGATSTGSYLFELRVTDTASTAETTTSSASSTVTVNSALTAPAAPTPSATSLDADQTLTVTGQIPATGTPTYSWQWLISVNGAGDVDASACGASSSGSNGAADATETCTVPGNTLTASTSYAFELQVSDSASTPVTETSAASATVMTSSALTAGTPSPTSSSIDDGQSITLTANPSGGSGSDSYQWYSGATAGGCTALGVPITGATSSTYQTSPTSSTYYCYTVVDSDSDMETSATGYVSVSPALLAPAVPTVSAEKLDANQVLQVTGTTPSTGTPTYSWQWLVSIDGGAYADATECAVNSGAGAGEATIEVCNIEAGTLAAGSNYTFELEITDSAGTPETATSPVSSLVSVSSTLSAPAVPTTSAAKLDSNQTLTVTGTIPLTGTMTYSWQWLVSVDGGAYANVTACVVNNGSGASPGAAAECTFPSGSLTAGDSYAFELQVTDNATTPEAATSSTSSTVIVNSALTAPSSVTPSATKLDINQGFTVSGEIPATGTPTYSWHWLVSIGNGSFVDATQCGATASGTGATGGATETCTIPSSTLTAGQSYTFELQATDSATTPVTQTSSASAPILTSPALVAGAPTPATPAIDDGQSVTLMAVARGGSGGYTYQWYSGSTAGACTSLGSAISGATSLSFSASPTTTTYFCYVVTDSATSPETQTSSASSAVVVNSPLTAPTVPTVSTTTLDVSQGLTVTGTLPTTGTATYSWQWLISINNGAFATATQCLVNAGNGAAEGSVETCAVAANTLTAGNTYSFELRVTDSSATPATQTSPGSATVAVTTAAPASSPSWWLYVVIALVVIVAVILVALLARRRPPTAVAAPIAPWDEGPETTSLGGGGSSPTPPNSAAASPSYVESPKDVGLSLPAVAMTPADRGTPATGSTNPEMDALLAELDKISDAIPKAAPKTGASGKPKPPADEAPES